MVIETRKPLTTEALLKDEIGTDLGWWSIKDECDGAYAEFTINRGAYVGKDDYNPDTYILARYQRDAKDTLYDTPSIQIVGYGTSLPQIVEAYNAYINDHCSQVGGASLEHSHVTLQAR